MNNNTGRIGLFCFALGVACALGLMVAHQHIVPSAYAQDAGGGKGWQAIGSDMLTKRGNGALWIYDADERVLASYICTTGRTIRLVGVRKVTWDLELREHPADKSKWSPNDLKQQWEATQKAGGN